MTSPSCGEPVDSAEVREHLDRILKSETFRKTESLRHLLSYCVTQAALGQIEQIKESVIAIEVFGRRPDFDGRSDNIVRVQAHRLRKLLDTYYSQEGADDRIKILIPKGSYVPQVAVGANGSGHAALDEALPAVPEVLAAPALPQVSRWWMKRNVLTFAAVFIAGALGGGWLTVLMPSRGAASQPGPAIAELWKGIFEPGFNVVVAFTNPAFLRVGHSQVFLLYRGPMSAPAGARISLAPGDPYMEQSPPLNGESLYFNEGWTGTGEVLAMNRLTMLSASFRSGLIAVPSRSLGLNTMRGNNVIFLGSPWGNGELSKVGDDLAPMFVNDAGAIVVRHPVKGEQANYRNDNKEVTQEITASYTLFSVLPGMENGRKIVSSAGLCTWATWAGIDFATTASGASQISQALRSANGGKLPQYFQAVIRTRIVKGTASNTTLVTTRPVSVEAAANGTDGALRAAK